MRTPNCVVVLTLILGVAASVSAQAPSPPPSPSPSPEPPKLGVSISGFYEMNGYSQNDFFFGKGAAGLVTDKDAYAVQVFRIQPEFAYGQDAKAVIRIDLAQGLFGLDDEVRDNDRPGVASLFSRKDTNFLVHLDWAYLEVTPGRLDRWTFRLGRMKNQLGNLIVLDQDGDGLQIAKQLGRSKLTLSWTKMSEGADALTDDHFTGGPDGRDADLLYLDLSRTWGQNQINPFVAYYDDRNRAASYTPQGIQYFLARFTPNVSRLFVVGAAGSAPKGKLALKGEAEFLTGKDEIRNASSGPRELLDVNDGDLSGYNVYLDAKYAMGKTTLGGVFGLGSGDKDPMSGKGNINKIRTNGFFYLTEVWEDSIMPDEEGITPQGLGSSAHRGYRELENTTLVQLNLARPLGKEWRAFLSGTLVRATQALHPWADANANGAIDPGEFGPASSKDLGKELDALFDWNLMPQLVWTFRGGVFFPGDAAGYQINGTNAFQKKSWELRTQIRFNFAGKTGF
jgi:hypothetical protein